MLGSALIMLVLRPKLRQWELDPQPADATPVSLPENSEVRRLSVQRVALDGE